MQGFDFFAVLALVGAALLLRGWGGRRAGDKPHCGVCGFELSGLATDAACPECGASHDVPRVTGERVYSRPLIFSGIALVLIAVLTLTVRNNYFLSGKQYYSIMPRSVLLEDARQGDRFAVGLIMDGLSAGTMVAADIPELIDHALELRHDRSAGQHWRGLADIAYLSGTLDAARRTRYIRESVQVGWKSLSDRHMRENEAQFYFESIASPSAGILIDAEIISAAVDGVSVRIDLDNRGFGRLCTVPYPELSSGRKLSVTWRVRYLDGATRQPVVPDWIHTAHATIPEMPGYRGFSGAWLAGDLDPSVLLNEEDREAWREQLETAKGPE